MSGLRFISSLAALALAAAGADPAFAQTGGATVIAVPPLAVPGNGSESSKEAAAIAWQATQVIAADLGLAHELAPLAPDIKDYYSYPEVTAPTFSKWRDKGAKALVTGFVQSRPDGRLTVGCYVYDVFQGRELGRKGFVVSSSEWRRAAHKCAGLAYSILTGAPGWFDTRIAYVAESGTGDSRVKRIAVMDSDGYDHHYLTAGEAPVLTPRFSPKRDQLAYVSFSGGQPHVEMVDLQTGAERPLLPGTDMSFAPSFSPDGGRIVFSMATEDNSDIYVVDADGGVPQRLTGSPGVDTAPSFSPDGARIVFESDRSGSQQIYVMNADGSAQQRISFGAGRYAEPEWSPDGQLIAFTRTGADGLRIGVMTPSGADERILTTGPADEGPSWAASGRDLLFQRGNASGVPGLYSVAASGGKARRIVTPQAGSDPDWSAPLD